MKRIFVAGLIIVSGFLFGCEPPQNAPKKDNDSDATTKTEGTNSEQTVRQTVEDFLAALRQGDEAGAMAMLTKTAQEKTAEHSMKIQPPGSNTAEFTVTEVEVYPETNEAQVLSSWSDNDRREIRQTYDIVWMLRKENGNWGILGMATKVFDDQRPIILNFEDPNELMREKQWAEQEIARRNAEEGDESVRTATKPGDSLK